MMNDDRAEIIRCPNCAAPLGEADLQREDRVTRCAFCNHVIQLPESAVCEPAVLERAPAPSRPEQIVHETGPGGELYLRWRWFNWTYIFLVFFCIAWDGFLVMWYSIAVAGAMAAGPFALLMFCFPLIHVAVGVGLTYFTIAGLFNVTQVMVDDQTLFIRHRPIPWRGNRDLPIADIQRIELSTQHHRSKNGTRTSYTVSAQDRDGGEIKLLSGLERKPAQYVAHQLSERLRTELLIDEEGGAGDLPKWLRR
jgi:hypothetical protein